MYSSAADQDSATLIGVYQGPQRDEDYERCIQSLVSSDALAAARALHHVCVLVTGADAQRPPPLWRRRMADANNALLAKDYHFALVSPSVLIRGVFTAITWLTRPRPGYRSAAFESFAQAAAWIRTETGRPYPRLESLYAAAQATSSPPDAARTTLGGHSA